MTAVLALASKFPFLIGTVRTLQQHSQRREALVSIPHRYGKNALETGWGASVPSKFPFLIGTVRTRNFYKKVNEMYLFPFLIGTVRTEFTRRTGKAVRRGFHSS